jgi:hypothetical protein
MAAASRAAARGARQEAVRLGEHALHLTAPDSPPRAERLLTLATSMESAGEPQRITDLLTPELPSIPAGPLRARAWLLLAEGAHVQTLHDFRNHLDHALAEARDDRVLRAYVRASTSSAVIGVERIAEPAAAGRTRPADRARRPRQLDDQQISAVMDRGGIEDSAHALRHTVATRLVRDHRHDLVLVADILGHADVKTTRQYARSGLEDRRAALEDLAG